MRKILLKVILGAICLEALLGVVFVLIGNIEKIGWKSIQSILYIIFYSIPCLCHAKNFDRNKLKVFSTIGIVLSSITCLYVVLSLWVHFSSEFCLNLGYYLKWQTWIFAFIALVLSSNNKRNIFSVFKTITTSLITILNIYMFLSVWFDFEPDGFPLRLLYAVSILTTAGSIGLFILSKIYGKETNNSMVVTENCIVTNEIQK